MPMPPLVVSGLQELANELSTHYLSKLTSQPQTKSIVKRSWVVFHGNWLVNQAKMHFVPTAVFVSMSQMLIY